MWKDSSDMALFTWIQAQINERMQEEITKGYTLDHWAIAIKFLKPENSIVDIMDALREKQKQPFSTFWDKTENIIM